MIDFRNMMIAGAVAGMVLGQGVTAAQAGPLLDRAVANPTVQTAALEPVELTDETMDGVSAGIWPAIALGATLAVMAFTAVVENDGLGHGCRGINCHNDP